MSRPFDEARYRGLLEGLEISVLMKTQADLDNPTGRLDAEFFQKAFLCLPRFPIGIGDCALIRSGTTPPDRDDGLEQGVILLKTVDIQNQVLLAQDEGNFYRISPEIAVRMKNTKLIPHDVLINIVGATTDVVGRVAFVPSGFPETNITQAMALIRVHGGEIWPETLFAFLAGKYGQRQVQRLARPTGQYNLNLQEVSNLRAPHFSENFSRAIRQIVEDSLQVAESAKQLQCDAEQTLLRALGLENWQPPEPLTFTRPSRDAFTAGRLDAEHFKPKYAELEAHIRATGSYTTLEDLLAINERGTQPDYAESGLPVVNSKHVAKGEVRLDDDNRLAIDSSKTLKIKKGDVLINGTGVGTIGRAAPHQHEQEALPDNHVTVLRPKESSIDPVYLSVFLNSLAGQYQVNKWLRGSSGQIELYPNDIAQFLVWIAPNEIQQSIRKAVDDAFTAKRNATRLLDAAKRAVEIAIETDEASALEFLNRETKLK